MVAWTCLDLAVRYYNQDSIIIQDQTIQAELRVQLQAVYSQENQAAKMEVKLL